MIRKLTLLLACLLLATVETYGLSWKIRPSADLRDDVLKLIQGFAEQFPADAAADRAKAMVADAKLRDDPHAWMAPTMELALDVLERHPLTAENDAIRKAALLILDYPIHVDNMAKDEPGVQEKWQELMVDYHVRALRKVADSVKATKVPAGKLAIWKVYNMGFVIKSENHCIGWDLVRASVMGKYMDRMNEPMAELLSQVECMFISHWHGDHRQLWCNQKLFEAGKPIFIPEVVPTQKIKVKNRSDERYTYVWENSEVPAGGYNGITFKSIPGHQVQLLNSLFSVTMDGLTILQTGDNGDKTVFAHFKELGRVDVLIGTCWSFIPRNGLEVAAQCKGEGITRPQFYITGHENELGHRPTNRESFQETYKRLGDRGKLPLPTFVLNIGEGLWYPDGTPIVPQAVD